MKERKRRCSFAFSTESTKKTMANTFIIERERERERERGERKRARYSDSGSIAARNVDERAWQAGCKGWKGSGAVRRSAVWSREVSRGWKRCERIGRCAGKRRKDVGVRAPTPLTSPRGEG